MARLRLLTALDEDFGGSGVLLPGGHATYLAYTEARAAFVSGAYLSVILLSQALVENLLGAHLVLTKLSQSIHTGAPYERSVVPERPALERVLNQCEALWMLSSEEIKSIRRLRGIRNPLTHYRSIDDPTNIERRAMDGELHPFTIMEGDARFAITTVVRLLSKPDFAIERRRSSDAEPPS